MAMQRAEELGALNDAEVVAVWHRVAQQIKRLATADGLILDGSEGERFPKESRAGDVEPDVGRPCRLTQSLSR